MPKVTRVAINATAGAQTPIVCNIPSRRVDIIEDGGAAPAGYSFTFPDATVQNVSALSSETEPLILGNKVAHSEARGAILGFPAQGLPMNKPATVYGNAKSLAGATTLVVTEYE